ncbi:MAG: MSCRAMM family protein [Nitrososphaerales archaeon]
MQILGGRKIITLATLLVLGISMPTFFPTPAVEMQEAWAHIDPPGCAIANSQIGITAFRGITPILGTGPVLQGETITFQANLDAASLADRCSREDGGMTIANPEDNKLLLPGTIVTPAGGIPCIGVTGANNFDDTDPPAPNGPNDGVPPDGDDCDEGADGTVDPPTIDNRQTVLSNTLDYVVDCADTQTAGPFAGQLLATAIWAGGFNHRVASSSDEAAGTATSQLGLNCVVPMIEWEKRLGSTTTTPHPLQGGAVFRVTPDPFDADPFLLVTDNAAPDVNGVAGQIKLNGTEIGPFTITEETAPANCTKDPGARMVTVSEAAPIQVVGTQGTDDDGGDVNERDFHNDCRGMIEWEKRRQTNGSPHPLQGGATFRVTPDPFDAVGTLDVVDNGANDINGTAGQIKLNGTLIGAYTIREIAAPPNCTIDPAVRSVTLTLAARNQVIGTQGVDDDGGDVNERDFHNTCDGRGTIIIKKDTVPNDPQDFSFTHNITSNPAIGSPFKLDDDSNPMFPNMRTFLEVPAGDYIVTETIVPSIPLLSIICIDPTGDSGRSGNSADIELDADETVTCTFVNGILEDPCEGGVLSDPQPEDPLSMTTIRSGNIVKTIHAEKQIFDCVLPQGDIPVIADVTIIAEIFEDINTQSIISKQLEVVTCIKMNSTGAILKCNLSIPSQDRIPVTNCSESPIDHPQEMNSIRKGSTAKTIETQKEVFICTMNTPSDATDDKKVDLVLFTDIYQNLNALTSEEPQILSMKCVIKIDNVTVESCRFTNHPL